MAARGSVRDGSALGRGDGGLTCAAIAAFFYGRRYVTFGWLWYVGTLVPVIGFVQVGEHAMADHYTYIPYVGLFVAIVWAIAEVLDRLPPLRRIVDAGRCIGDDRHTRHVGLVDAPLDSSTRAM